MPPDYYDSPNLTALEGLSFIANPPGGSIYFQSIVGRAIAAVPRGAQRHRSQQSDGPGQSINGDKYFLAEILFIFRNTWAH